jgi:hypothetical protein
LNHPPAPHAQRRDVFERFTFPSPFITPWFSALVSSCFYNLHPYLSGQRCTGWPEVGDCAHPRALNFEVRAPERVEVGASTLLAVFHLRSITAALRPIIPNLAALRRDGVDVEEVNGPSTMLEQRVRGYISSHAR